MTTPEMDDCLGLMGKAVSVPDNTNLKCSLTTLSHSAGHSVQLWGKVEGYHADYYVAQAASKGGSPTDVDARRTWCSVDGGISWIPLPQIAHITAEQQDFCTQLRGPYMGQPGYEYKVQKELPREEAPPMDKPDVEEAPEEEPEGEADEDGEKEEGDAGAEGGDANGEDEEGDKKPATKRPKFRILAMTEAIRLAFFVSEHDRTCAIVPRSALIRKADGTVIINRSFGGLDVAAARNPRNYFHLVTPPPTAARQLSNSQLFGDEYNASWDFLTPIVVDMPEGVWTAKYDALLNVVVVHNHLFNGSVFWHQPNTNKTGQLYWGKGERNLDLCFVLP
jgi:radial spoke head protein 9